MAEVRSVITVGRKTYRRFEIFVDGHKVYSDSTMTPARSVLERKAREHDAFLNTYVRDGNTVTEQVVEL